MMVLSAAVSYFLNFPIITKQRFTLPLHIRVVLYRVKILKLLFTLHWNINIYNTCNILLVIKCTITSDYIHVSRDNLQRIQLNTCAF